MISRKLDGFTSFKATCVLKLQINAQPFQCGRLLMAAAPMPGLLGNRRQFIFSHVSNAQNLNHVQMDIAKDTEVELRIPFISPYNCYDLVDGKFDWAEVRILVYSPLNATETKCLQCLVYGHFEDIEMGAPTSGGVKQQSGYISDNPVQQSLMPSRAQVDETKRVEATGKFTGALAQLGSSLVNKGLSIARPLTGTVDSVIAAMGWSKPILAKPSKVLLQRPTEGFQYMDGIDHSLVLGMTASNAIEPIKGLVGTNIDETSFNTLKRIPQMIGVFTYSSDIITCTDDNRAPVKLWECAISPSCNVPACYYITPPTTGTNVRNPYGLRWKQPTTLNYISSPFLYWKGSLVYTFKFVKTNYHSGRVEISFHPFVNTVNTDRMDFVYRTVIDLRDNSEVSLTVPYIAAQPYKRISTFLDPVNPDPPAPGRLKDVITGILYVRALTPLICATTIIAKSIEVLVEMRAGDDYEVAAPVTSKFLPFSLQNENPIQQGGSVTPNINFKKIIGNAKPIIPPIVLPRFVNPKQQSGDLPVVARVPDSIRGGITVLMGSYQRVTMDQDQKTISLDLPTQYVGERVLIYIQYGIVLPGPGVGGKHLYQVSSSLESGINSLLAFSYDNWGAYVTPSSFGSCILPSQINLTVSKIGNATNVDIIMNYTIFLNDSALTVSLNEKQFPLPCAFKGSVDPLLVKLDESQIPLPVKGDSQGGTVSIDPDQLPLWVSSYNVAPRNPREQAGSIAMAGVTETRTRAMEGWMPPSITGNARDAHRPDLTHLCIGEKFNSFRQYAKRFAFCLVNGLDSTKMFPIQPVELIRPGALYLRPTESTTGNNERTQLCLYAPNTKAEVSGSPLAFVAGMYAFYRGSIRTKVWMDPRDNPPTIVSGHLEYSRQTVDSNIIDDAIENFMTPIAYETPNTKQIPEYQVPYYSPTIVSSTWSHGIDNQFDIPLVNLVLSIPDFKSQANTYPIKVAVAAGDDMDFHQFIGPPPVINTGDLTVNQRPLHYPPTGFTPTQKIALDTPANRRTEQPASSFIAVPYSALKIQNNANGGSCPTAPTELAYTLASKTKEPISVNRVRRSVVDTLEEGVDTVDTKRSGSAPCPCSNHSLSDYELE
jgi:hypothetical protein